MKKLSYFPLNCFINWVFSYKNLLENLFYPHTFTNVLLLLYCITKIAFKIDLNSLENESLFANLTTFHSHSCIHSHTLIQYSTIVRYPIYSSLKLNGQFSFVRHTKKKKKLYKKGRECLIAAIVSLLNVSQFILIHEWWNFGKEQTMTTVVCRRLFGNESLFYFLFLVTF